MSDDKVTCAKSPCPSCPYRRDVPSGIWHASEYEKLRRYDRDTMSQPAELFMCHKQTGRLCSGWVACHGGQLLALRLGALRGTVDPSVFAYESPVPVFASGAEAARHGEAEIDEPGESSRRFIQGLLNARRRRA